MEITKDIVILYHKKCPDGFSGSWVAWKKFGDSAEYVPCAAGSAAPDDIEGKTVYMIDYTPDTGLKEFVSKNKAVVAIDHHASNEVTVPLATEFRFDNNKCGSVLAWEYFFPDKLIPTLLLYVQDMDIWQWKMPDSHALAMYIDLSEQSFENWNKMADDFEDSQIRADLIKQSALVLRYKDKLTQQTIDSDKQLVEFEGMEIYAVNSSVNASYIGNTLAEMKPPMAIVWSESDESIHVSLRSKGEVDVSIIAKKYDGGGHPKASGFGWPLDKPKPWKIIKSDET